MTTASEGNYCKLSVPSAYVQRYCAYTSPTPIEEPCADFVLPLIVTSGKLGETEHWYSNSYDSVSDGSHFGFAFKLAVEATNAKLGTVEVIPRPPDRAYQKVIGLLGRRMAHLKLSKEERQYLDERTKPTLYVNFRDAEAIAAATTAAIAENEKWNNRNKQGGQQQQEEEPATDFYEAETLAQAGVATWNTAAGPVPESVARLPRYTGPGRIEIDANNAQGDGEQQELGEDASSREPEARKPCPKIIYTLSCIPSGDPQVQLYIARFSIMDKSISLGEYVNHLLVQHHRNNEASAPVTRGYRSLPPYPEHMELSKTDHPFFNMSRARYLAACFGAMNRKMIKSEVDELMSGWDVTSNGATLNPVNVFTLENAFSVIQKYTEANLPHSAAQIGRFLDTRLWRGFRQYRWPEGMLTYIIPPEQVFWIHRKYVGLYETILPKSDQHLDFATSVLNGVSMDEVINSNAGPLEPTEASMEDDMLMLEGGMLDSDDRREIDPALCKVVINRRDVHQHSAIRYKTDNALMHIASQFDHLYKKVFAEMPINCMQIYHDCKPFIKARRNHWRQQMPESADREFLATRHLYPNPELHPNAAIREAWQKHRYQWKLDIQLANPDLYKNVVAYERYGKLMRALQASALEKFAPLWKLSGNVDNIPIPESCRAILRWAQEHKAQDGIVTRPLTLRDPDLDFFATSIVKMMGIYSQCARVVQPLLCITTHGLFSCHDYTPGRLNFHMGAFGRHDLGKTFQLLTTMLNYTSIPGVALEETRATMAAADAGTHVQDVIMLKDEIAKYYVSKAEAERNSHLVNTQKVLLTRKTLDLTAAVLSKDADGKGIRSTEKIHTDHDCTFLFVTNEAMPEVDALTSRFFTFIMKDPGVNVTEKEFSIDESVKNQGRDHLRWMHFHSASARKAAMAGVILRDPEMTLYVDVSNRMRAVLEEMRVLVSGEGGRIIEKMSAILRQFIILTAALHTWDVPGSPHYGKPYNISQIQDMQPYLYVTLQHILFVWTLLASQFVDDNKSAALIAAIRTYVDAEWKPERGESTYSLFVRSTSKQGIPFKKGRNMFYDDKKDPPDAPEDFWLIDLNYITIKGNSLKEIFDTTAAATDKRFRMCGTDIEGVLRPLCNVSLPPPRNGYRAMPEGTLRRLHCMVQDGVLYDEEGNEHPNWVKQPQTYNGVTKIWDEDDIPPHRIRGQANLPVVIIEPPKSKSKATIHIAPWAIPKFNQDVIVDAFEHATMCYSFPRQKMILGRTCLDNPNLLEIANYAAGDFTTKVINKLVAEDAKEQEMVSAVISREERVYQAEMNSLYGRDKGISFLRGECMSFGQTQILLDEPLVHCDGPGGEESQLKRYKAEAERCRAPFEFVADLEKWSALKQHLKCGYALDAPVMTPSRIKKRYLETNPPEAKLDYPSDLAEQDLKKKKIRNAVPSVIMKRSRERDAELDKLRLDRGSSSKRRRVAAGSNPANAASAAEADEGSLPPALAASSDNVGPDGFSELDLDDEYYSLPGRPSAATREERRQRLSTSESFGDGSESMPPGSARRGAGATMGSSAPVIVPLGAAVPTTVSLTELYLQTSAAFRGATAVTAETQPQEPAQKRARSTSLLEAEDTLW